jgi:GntR family transcriptional regulator, transcriptional repressor for pyruvate dehydrogenase complex
MSSLDPTTISPGRALAVRPGVATDRRPPAILKLVPTPSDATRRVPDHHESAEITGTGTARYVASPLGQRQEKRSEQVARQILHEISSQQLAQGTPLPAEAAMCATYGVGRPTLREALRILEVNGLLALKPGPGGGPQVLAPTPAAFARVATLHFQAMGVRVHELAHARASVEGTLAAMAATATDPDGLARLQASVEAADTGTDQGAVLDAGYEFHTAVMALAPNPVLREWGMALQDALNARLGHVHAPQALDEVRQDHRAIAKAIADRDAVGAEQAMAQHWSRTLQVPSFVTSADLPIEWT